MISIIFALSIENFVPVSKRVLFFPLMELSFQSQYYFSFISKKRRKKNANTQPLGFDEL